jgi:ATP-dependent Clp protease ATP-binding subunit ClpX
VSGIPTLLLDAAGGDVTAAAGGIVCLDEFDKLAASRSNARFAGEGSTKDVSGLGTQRGLLTLLSAREYPLSDEHGTPLRGHGTLPLRGVTFIACGAFTELKATVRAMGQEGHQGPDGDSRRCRV